VKTDPWINIISGTSGTNSGLVRFILTVNTSSAVRSGVESEGKFKVVNEHTPGTLQIDVRLVSLTPWASRDEKVETLGSGTLTFEAHVRDAATSELLAVYQGTQNVGKEYQANTPANKMTDIKQHFTDWGRNISKRLAAAQAL